MNVKCTKEVSTAYNDHSATADMIERSEVNYQVRSDFVREQTPGVDSGVYNGAKME